MMTDIQTTKTRIHNNLSRLKQEYHVERIGVFGSVARGQETGTSDIDILVEFSQPIGLFKFIELEETLGQLLQRKVDLVTPNALKTLIKDRILEQTLYV